MICHIVLFKLKDNSLENKEKIKALLLSMDGKCPMIRGMDAGYDVLNSARSYDVALTVRVDNLAALAAYQADPYHCGTVKPTMHEATSSSVACDYEL